MEKKKQRVVTEEARSRDRFALRAPLPYYIKGLATVNEILELVTEYCKCQFDIFLL